MGYSTDFTGSFKTNKPVDESTYKLLQGLAATRRMNRSDLPEEYGVDGEFYIEDEENCGQSQSPKLGKIVNCNTPPSTQPGLWLQWIMLEDHQTIEWDGNEKFYQYVEWIVYLIEKILKPRGYIVSGEVEWYGEDRNDEGIIKVEYNVVMVGTVEKNISKNWQVIKT